MRRVRLIRCPGNDGDEPWTPVRSQVTILRHRARDVTMGTTQSEVAMVTHTALLQHQQLDKVKRMY